MSKDKKNVWLLGLTSFFTDFSSDAVMSLLSISVGSTALVGLLGGIVNGLGSIFKLLFGYLSEKIGNNKLPIFWGYALSAISKISIPFVGQIGLMVALTIDRIGKGIRTSPRDAILAMSNRKGWAFGWHRAMDKMGAIAGSIFAYLLVVFGQNYQQAIFWAAVIGLISLIPIPFVKDTPLKPLKEKTTLWDSVVDSPKELKKFMIPVAIFSLSLVSPMLLIRSVSESIGALSILVFAGFNLLYAVSTQKFGTLSDKVGRKPVLVGSFIISAMGFGFAAIGGLWALLGFALYGMGIGAWRSTATAAASEFAKGRATGIGIYHLVNGLSIFVGSILVGSLLAIYGSVAYFVCVAFSILAIRPLTKCAC